MVDTLYRCPFFPRFFGVQVFLVFFGFFFVQPEKRIPNEKRKKKEKKPYVVNPKSIANCFYHNKL